MHRAKKILLPKPLRFGGITLQFTYVEFHDHTGKMEGAAFLRNVVAAFPCKIHKVLTDNGMAFADLPKNWEGSTQRFLGPHIFDRVCL
jgi:hypothetical protein